MSTFHRQSPESTVSPAGARSRPREPGLFRAVPEDGSLLFFDPVTGANVRWASRSTEALRRRLPRVAMFGITNHCNLACGYCSRDAEARSAWTVESAARLLEGLEAHGLLEVAFGGGEPFAFRGFDALVERLGRTTRLALHATTNGTLLSHERLARLRPFLGELRLSIHDDPSWPDAVRLLADSGIRFGANVLAFPERLETLAFLLERLESLGCTDVALLRPIGSVGGRDFSTDDEARLGELVRGTRLRVRLSACFADRLREVPRLFEPLPSDCGAGTEFFTLTPDRRLLPCSFHAEAVPVSSAEDVLAALGREAVRFRSPAPRRGCGRDRVAVPERVEGIHVWNAFSSNNSGDCVLVGRFESEADARRLLESLAAGFAPSQPFSEDWRRTLGARGIECASGDHAPDTLEVVGRTLLAHTGSAIDDDFPPLRRLVWASGGRSVYDGIHEHAPLVLLAGLGFTEASSLGDAEVELGIAELGAFLRKGLALYGTVSVAGAAPDALSGTLRALEAVAERHGGVLAGELVVASDAPRLAELLAARPRADAGERLFLRCESGELADELARELGGVAAGRRVLMDRDHVSSRLGAYALRRAMTATVLPGGRIALEVALTRPRDKGPIEVGPLLAELRAELGPDGSATLEARWGSAAGTVETEVPERVLPFLAAFATARGLTPWLEARPLRPLVDAMARVEEDLVVLRRR